MPLKFSNGPNCEEPSSMEFQIVNDIISKPAKKTMAKPSDVNGFVGDIEDLTEANENFRKVLYTSKNLQLVLMSLLPGEEIGEETHPGGDQFFRIETGKGEVWINGHCTKIKGDDGIVVPAGARHNIVNTGDEPLRLYTLYGPPAHQDGLVQETKPGPKSPEEHFDGRTTEW
jgi:mannose-6-phosphate isomerase-like protein (cupin superfamily)